MAPSPASAGGRDAERWECEGRSGQEQRTRQAAKDNVVVERMMAVGAEMENCGVLWYFVGVQWRVWIVLL